MKWTITIERDGGWPFPWNWYVCRQDEHYNIDSRMGWALTKDRAHRKVAKARISIERDDTRIEEE